MPKFWAYKRAFDTKLVTSNMREEKLENFLSYCLKTDLLIRCSDDSG